MFVFLLQTKNRCQSHNFEDGTGVIFGHPHQSECLRVCLSRVSCNILCSHLTSAFASTSKFNIASVVTQTQIMGLNPFSASTFALILTQC